MNGSSSMKASEWLKASERLLAAAGIATARLDCLVLLEDQTGRDRGWLLAHPEYVLQRSQSEKLDTKIAQRIQHIPLGYIRGKAEFYGREFAVNEHTLVPRPETESIIDLLKTLGLPPDTIVLDIGTGSGCIAITAALEIPALRVYASDIDPSCLAVARSNARRLGAAVQFHQGNLLEGARPCDVLLCNLPYVPENFQINRAATHEPRHALFGGPDGLDLYRQLFGQVQTLARQPHSILAESLPPQHETLAAIAKAAGYALAQTDGFVQRFERV